MVRTSAASFGCFPRTSRFGHSSHVISVVVSVVRVVSLPVRFLTGQSVGWVPGDVTGGHVTSRTHVTGGVGDMTLKPILVIGLCGRGDQIGVIVNGLTHMTRIADVTLGTTLRWLTKHQRNSRGVTNLVANELHRSLSGSTGQRISGR